MDFGCEISWGGDWVDLNDTVNYKVSGDGTRDNTTTSYRKIEAQSPMYGGSYLIHAVPEMVVENVSIRVHGSTQAIMIANFQAVQEYFSQFEYQMRWTFDNQQETWNCELADANVSRAMVWSHNKIALASFSVPRFPDVEVVTI